MNQPSIMNNMLIHTENLEKTYLSGPDPLLIWKHICLDIQAGELLAIVGSSGSGKTTLLNVLGSLDFEFSGQLYFKGQKVKDLNDKQRTAMRNRDIGFVYQFHHLLPEFSALENVMFPVLLRGGSPKEAKQKASEFLERLGLKHRLKHKPTELSGGERQRTAIARALVNSPSLVLMDEPTGNLDPDSAKGVEEMMFDVQKELDTTFILATHDHQLASRMQRCFVLKNQTLQEQIS